MVATSVLSVFLFHLLLFSCIALVCGVWCVFVSECVDASCVREHVVVDPFSNLKMGKDLELILVNFASK